MLHWHFEKHELSTREDVRGQAVSSSSSILETNVLICFLHRWTILEYFVDATVWASWIKPFLLLAYGNVYGAPKFSKHISICSKEGYCGVGIGLLPLDPHAAQRRILPHLTARHRVHVWLSQVKDRKRNHQGWGSSHLSPKALKKNGPIRFFYFSFVGLMDRNSNERATSSAFLI